MSTKQLIMNIWKAKLGYQFTYKDLCELEETINYYDQKHAPLRRQIESLKQFNQKLLENKEQEREQRYFINYLEGYIELLNDEPDAIEVAQSDLLKEILEKYKKITKNKKEK